MHFFCRKCLLLPPASWYKHVLDLLLTAILFSGGFFISGVFMFLINLYFWFLRYNYSYHQLFIIYSSYWNTKAAYHNYVFDDI